MNGRKRKWKASNLPTYLYNVPRPLHKSKHGRNTYVQILYLPTHMYLTHLLSQRDTRGRCVCVCVCVCVSCGRAPLPPSRSTCDIHTWIMDVRACVPCVPGRGEMKSSRTWTPGERNQWDADGGRDVDAESCVARTHARTHMQCPIALDSLESQLPHKLTHTTPQTPPTVPTPHPRGLTKGQEREKKTYAPIHSLPAPHSCVVPTVSSHVVNVSPAVSRGLSISPSILCTRSELDVLLSVPFPICLMLISFPSRPGARKCGWSARCRKQTVVHGIHSFPSLDL
jgi:hypothetical protein